MSITHVYTAQVDARQHVFEPLQPMVPGGLGRTGTALAASAYTRDQFDQAAREAYERGLAEGKQLVNQELLRVVHAMSETVKRAMVEQEAVVQGLQQDALGLSLAIARQVIMGELRSNPDVICQVLTRLIEEAEGRKVFAVQLHPDDIERIKASPVGTLLEQADIEMKPAPDLTPGGCVLDTAFGKLDARLETRMDEIAATLLGHDRVNETNEETSE